MLPIFLQPWWMDAVCAGKAWDVILVERDGKILAAMPYLIRKRMGLRFVLMPQQTQIGGVWIDQQLHDSGDRAAIGQVLDNVIEQLNALKLAYYYQHFAVRNPLAIQFAERGFLVRERVTYRIEDTSDMEVILRHMSKNKMRQLHRAQTAGLVLDTDMTAEDFYRAHQACLTRQGKQITYSREFLLVLERKTARNGQSQFLAVRTPAGELCAAVYLVWDNESVYYLIPFYNPQYKDSGAGAMLAVEAIKVAHDKGLIFDFEGSMVPGIANHYRQFGSDPAIYYSIERANSLFFRLMLWAQQLMVRLRHKM